MSVFSTVVLMANDELADVPAPLEYQGSHVLPDVAAGARRGVVELAMVPGHVPVLRELEPTCPAPDPSVLDVLPPFPVLRLSVSSGWLAGSTVLLDCEQAAVLRDALSAWLDLGGVPASGAAV